MDESNSMLNQGERDYRTLVENLPGMVYRVCLRENRRMHFFNNLVAEMTGYTAGELSAGHVCSIDPLILEEDRQTVIDIVSRAIRERHAFTLAYRIRHKNGAVRHFAERGRLTCGDDGEPLYIEGVIFDVTDHERAENALRESEERFRQVTEHIEEVFFLITPDWNEVLYISPAYEKVWGRSCQSLYESARSWMEAIAEEDRPVAIGSMEQGIAGDLPKVFPEYRILRPDGAQRWIQARAWPIFDDQDSICRIAGIAEDITDRKRAEEAQRRECNLLDSIIRTTDVMLVLLDPQFNFVWVNPAYADTCKMKPEEMIGKNHFALYPSAENEAIFRKVRDTGEGVSYKDKAFAFPDQPERGVTYWDWSLTPVKDATGQLASLVFSLRETTKSKQAEEAMREHQERYRVLAETMLQGVVHQDAEGRIIAMNPAAERILGKSVKDFLGSSSIGEERHTIREDGSPFPGVEHPAMVALQTGQHLSGVVMGVLNPRENNYRWISIDAVPVFRPGEDHPYQVYTVFEDITDRKRAEEALRQSHDELQSIYGGMRDGLVIVDVGTKRFIRTNPAMCRMLGYREDELLSMSVPDIHPPDAMPAVRERFQMILDGESKYFTGVRVLTKDGTVMWVDISDRCMVFDGRPCAIAFFHDITERIEMEKVLQRSKEAAEAANVAKSRFLANMSHELRTPMNAILGMIDVALPKATDPTVQDCLQTAKGSADLLLTLLNGLLDSAKIESGKLELELAPFSLRRMLDQTTRVLSMRKRERIVLLLPDGNGDTGCSRRRPDAIAASPA